MAERVVVTGTGAICGTGKSPAEILTALCAWRSAIRPIEQWDASNWPARTAAEVVDYNPAALAGDRKLLKLIRRTDVFGLYAAGQAIEAAGIAAHRDTLDPDADAGAPHLSSFERIKPDVQQRITYRLGERYERLRLWLAVASAQDDELDHFLSHLFGELLSQAGFGFHTRYDAGRATASLIESVQKFRWVTGPALEELGVSVGREYYLMVQEGVIADQYISSWQSQPQDAVLLAPAYTFLMNNRPVEVQFWLDAGSRGWTERLYQPLTHPFVLSRSWEPGRIWCDADDKYYKSRQCKDPNTSRYR